MRKLLVVCSFACLIASLAGAGDSFELRMGGYAGDPLHSPPGPPEDLSLFAGQRVHRVVQFKRSITRTERTLLQNPPYGLALDDYLGAHCYLEFISRDALKALPADLVRHQFLFGSPALNVEGELLRLLREPGAASREIEVRAILFEEADFPHVESQLTTLSRSSVESIRYLGIHPLRDRTTVRFKLSVDDLKAAAEIPGIRRIERVGAWVQDNGTTAGTVQLGSPDGTTIWSEGIHGENQTVHVIGKTRVDVDHCWFSDPLGVPAGPGHRKVKGVFGVQTEGDHSTFVAGIIAGDDHNNLGAEPNRGIAYGANLVSTGLASKEGLLKALLDGESAGATIHTTSWHVDQGDPSTYDDIARMVDAFTWTHEDQLVVGSAGNNGDELGPPGTAKNALAVAATGRYPNDFIYRSGNLGPTADGRTKPDLCAPGCKIMSSPMGISCGAENCADVFQVACATSWAAPAVAAGAALVRQYYSERWYPTGTKGSGQALTPSGALLKATLLNATWPLTKQDSYPGDAEGWGRLLLERALYFAGDSRNLHVRDVWNADGLATGEGAIETVEVAASGEPLRITLVWTSPATGNLDAPIVNDLDLLVYSPDGTKHLGNDDATAPDDKPDEVNNVEQVVIGKPAEGDWRIEIFAEQVAVGSPGQGYALVVTGALAGPQLPRLDPGLRRGRSPHVRESTDKATRRWFEIQFAESVGGDTNVFLEGRGDPDPQPDLNDRFQTAHVDVSYRLTSMRKFEIAKNEEKKELRTDEIAVGLRGSWTGQEEASSARQNDYGLWVSFEKNLSKLKEKYSAGLLVEHAGLEVDGDMFETTNTFIPAFSIAWGKHGKCDTNRSVFFAILERRNDRQEPANSDFDRDGFSYGVGVRHSLVEKLKRERDWRCGARGVFRSFYPDDRGSLHLLAEIRRDSAELEFEHKSARLGVEGQVPLRKRNRRRDLTLALRAEHSRACYDHTSFYGTNERRDRITTVGGEVAFPLISQYTRRKYAEAILRIGGSYTWNHSNTSFYRYERGVYLAMLDIVFGTRRTVPEWPDDTPSPGGSLEPPSGSGPKRPRQTTSVALRD